MTENVKTVTFVAVALVVAAIAVFVSRPSLPVASSEDVRGQLLYPEFRDPLEVTSLEIVEFNEDTGEVHPFQVAQVDVKGKGNARWSIPSHEDYPADAKDQVASAAEAMMGLKIIETVSDNQGDQREYGVVAPDVKTLKVGDTGVGEQVVMKNKEHKTLLDLVIGKEAPGGQGLRYVRKAGEEGIYVVAIKTDKLSEKFEDWIERNLLQISSFDISRLWIRDYAIKNMREGLAIIQRGEMQLEHNDAGEPKWKMIEDRKYVPDEKSPTGGHWAAVKMAAGEELNTAKLDEMMTALDDLKIVDVSRKPAGLSADLKVSANFASQGEAAIQSLEDKGFFLARLGNQVELFSNEGEIRIGGKDGVEYVLRFGDIAGAGASKKSEKKKGKEKEAEKDQEKKTSPGLNRYLFVMAEFNPELIPKPQLEPLPEARKPEVKKSEIKKPEAKKDAEKKPVESKKGEAAKPVEKKATEKDKAEKDKAEKKMAEKKEAEKKAEQAERARIERDNKRKQEEHQQKIADGKKRVGELNARFADWYYVISDEVYRKIHLGRDELVKKKEPAKAKDSRTSPQSLPPSADPQR